MKKPVSYKNCVEYLFGLERAGIKYDLKNIKVILKYLGNPEKKYKSIHVAGTNGKGSVASIINSVFSESGFETGLYTSPHIKDFRERILVNGNIIPENFVTEFTSRMFVLFEEIKPSFFEVTTAMAFEYFANQKVDYAVIEAGLGGRLDSTNVLKPVISIITGISIDHTEYLGNTIQSIACEKAGIIKKYIPCVIGHMDKVSYGVISKKCRAKKSKLLNSGKFWSVKIIKGSEDIMGLTANQKIRCGLKLDLKFPIVGKYQIHNIKTALTSLYEISEIEKIVFTEKNIKAGFKKVIINSKFYGRFQKIESNPKIVIDVSHNVQGIKNIKENLKLIGYNRLFVIFGMMKDKEYEKCLKELEKLNAKIILTKPDYKRAEEPEILFKSVRQKEKFFISENISAAYKYVLKSAGKKDLILVTGSFFLISDFLKLKPFNL
jgi:dihydrofolate synthase / folylpolyglutamate synthase